LFDLSPIKFCIKICVKIIPNGTDFEVVMIMAMDLY
jgi:hypothetical protein